MSTTNGSGLLSREDILGIDDLKTAEVEVPEWGGKVRIRELTGSEREEFDSMFSTVKQRIEIGGQRGRPAPQADIEIHAERVRVRLCMLSMIDEDGERLFPSETDVALLGAKSAKALHRVFQNCWELSGMGAEGLATEGKGSDTEGGDDLPSESPAT